MTGIKLRKLPKRLCIDFRSTRPTYELRAMKGCSRRDLVSAGLQAETVDALLWNSYSKTAMSYTLVRPEEWFWTDRDWWEESQSQHVAAVYELSGGSFMDLPPPAQADLLGAKYIHLTGKKTTGNRWLTAQGEALGMVRYVRRRLIENGYDIAPAYPENINLLVRNHCKDEFGKDPTFIGAGTVNADALRRFAQLSVDDLLNNPEQIWDKKPDYYLAILNGFRKIKDFDKSAMLKTLTVIGNDTYSRILHHYWTNQTYENQMTAPNLPPLVGRKNERLDFFFVTQKATFRSEVARFVRDYAKPLGLTVSLIQVSSEANI